MSQVHVPDFLEGPPPRQRIATNRYGMVASAHDGATQAGVEMLEAGGNAFDAAVAAAFACGVCEPQASGLGGQSMVLFHDAVSKKTVALDGSSRAPEKATPEVIPADARRLGYKATTVPSTPAVMADLIAHHCVLSLEEILTPAIRIAEEGYRVSRLQHQILNLRRDDLRKHTGGRFFLKDRKKVYDEGDLHVQETLGATLAGLQTRGLEDFYKGRVARAIVRDMDRNGGLLTMRDLAQVPWPVARKPDLGRWHGRRVATFPPPGAGRVLLELLHVYDRTPKRFLDMDTPEGAVFHARAMQQALRDHMNEPRDPARHQMTPHQMIHQDHARVLALQLRRHLPETTHLSVMDRDGNAVGITQSIEQFYGSCSAAKDLGFLYNDYISAFARNDDPGHPYALRPNGVPWSSVAPAIVFKRKKPVMIVGSPGSDRIPTSIAQVLQRLRSTDPMKAVEAPRLHARPSGSATLEAPRFRSDVADALEADGFDVVRHDAYSTYHGCVQMVLRRGRDFIGVADPRRDGTACGPGDVGVRR